ncbi:hypothetical protein F5984_10115 [Rudanella paleaurantiibacter]|uniref:Uncharacterized protein n=2 Tax=Rudanella paleaurantiibacter TaxID=2614655 RepID=A0A7J5U1T6_9BACT|nr:hypothetical protein F5984_10115 [Rudanella paleaurantiibacter]
MVGRTDAFKENIRKYYENQQLPSGRASDPPVTYNGVDIDVYGHPNFVPFVPQLADGRKIRYTSQTLNGTITDMKTANTWASSYGIENFEGLPNGRCKIKDASGTWVECVWHHHEDGRTLMPVPIEVHNRSFSAAGTGVPHTGGAAVIRYGIQDFFPSPQY